MGANTSIRRRTSELLDLLRAKVMVTGMNHRCMEQIFVAAVILLAAAASGTQAGETNPSLAQKMQILIKSYPDTLSRFAGGKLFFRDGGPPIEVANDQAKTYQQMLIHADVAEMLWQIYPLGPCETHPSSDFDPGRIRTETLLKRLYGSTPAEVAAHLTYIDWFGTRLAVTTAQGVNRALVKVRDEIAKLPKSQRRPALKSAGTYYWRDIAGTRRLSVHSFGAAIDLDTNYADYWRWSHIGSGRLSHPASRIPMQIVNAFERHGFIWGGRWYHYDTMHFEYRPELLAIAKKAGASACAARAANAD